MLDLARWIPDGIRRAIAAPTVHDRVLAGMYLHAVLPRLADLVRLDDEAREIARGLDLAVGFRVVRGPRALIELRRGEVAAHRDGGGDVCLLFPTCSLLNRMFAGEKVTPLPLWGLHRLGALKALTRLTDRLTAYLKPSDEAMRDAALRAKHVELSLLVGLAATREVARHDPRARRVAEALHDATIQYRVLPDGPVATVEIRHGEIEARPGGVADPSTSIDIQDLDLAVGLIRNQVDTFAANGAGRIKASGDLHVADQFNHLFERVGFYLH